MIIGIVVGVACLGALAYYFLAGRPRKKGRLQQDLHQALLENDGLELGTIAIKALPTQDDHSIAIQLRHSSADPAYPRTDSEQALCLSKWKSNDGTYSTDNGTTMVKYSVIELATKNFDSSLQIGDGNSCAVYQAVIYGEKVAVKVLKPNASAWSTKQFSSEVALLTHLIFHISGVDSFLCQGFNPFHANLCQEFN